jgi:hypothetical protein
VFLIGQITGFATLHQASCAQMNYAVQCLNAHIFDWSTTLLDCMKRQLTDCRSQTQRNFGFGTILCSFFFERMPSFSPREVVQGHQASLPTICRWVVLLPQEGGGRTNESFDENFFSWLSRQISVIEDYPYVGIDFSIDPEIPIPLGEERGEMGKFASFVFFFLLTICNFYVAIYIYIYIYIIFFIPEHLIDMCQLCVDVGPM